MLLTNRNEIVQEITLYYKELYQPKVLPDNTQ